MSKQKYRLEQGAPGKEPWPAQNDIPIIPKNSGLAFNFTGHRGEITNDASDSDHSIGDGGNKSSTLSPLGSPVLEADMVQLVGQLDKLLLLTEGQHKKLSAEMKNSYDTMVTISQTMHLAVEKHKNFPRTAEPPDEGLLDTWMDMGSRLGLFSAKIGKKVSKVISTYRIVGQIHNLVFRAGPGELVRVHRLHCAGGSPDREYVNESQSKAKGLRGDLSHGINIAPRSAVEGAIDQSYIRWALDELDGLGGPERDELNMV